MIVKDKTPEQRKSYIVRTMMNNPNLRKVVFEAVDSPVGSTKKAKLKTIMLGMHRTSQRQDGQGGGSLYDGQGGVMDYINSLKDSWNNGPLQQRNDERVSFLKGVDERVNNQPEQSSIVGEFGKAYGTGVWNALKGGVAAGNSLVGDVIYPWAKTGVNILGSAAEGAGTVAKALYGKPEAGDYYFTNKLLDSDKNKTSAASSPIYPTPTGAPISGKTAASSDNNPWFRVAGTDEVYDKATGERVPFEEAKAKNIWDRIDVIASPNITAKLSTDAYNKYISHQSSTQAYVSARQQGADRETAIKYATDNTGVSPDTALADSRYRFPSASASAASNTSSTGASAGTGTGASGVIGDARSAYDSGMGKEGFIYSTLLNKDKLASFLGLTKEEATALPEGLLSTQLTSLSSALRKQYRLDEQLNSLLKLQNEGYTIKTDLTSYIRGKDQYLGDIDKLLTDARKQMANMDVSNPAVASRMQNYVNYLTTLHGRQSQRYIDFLNTSIEAHNTQITQAQNTYNSALSQYNTAYESGKATTTESYTMMKEILGGMYDAVEKQDEMELEKYKLETERINSEASNALKAVQAQKILSELQNPSGDKITSATAEMYRKYYTAATDKDTGVITFSVTDPMQVRNSAVLGGDATGNYAVDQFLKDAGYSIENKASTGDLSSFNTFKSSLNDLTTNASKLSQEISGGTYSGSDLATAQKALNTYQADASGLYSQLYQNTIDGLKQYFSSSEEKSSALKKAIRDLSNLEGKWAGISFGYSRDKFVSSYSGEFGTLAGTMYDMTNKAYTTLKNGDASFQSADIFADIDKENPSYDMANALTNYLLTK